MSEKGSWVILILTMIVVVLITCFILYDNAKWFKDMMDAITRFFWYIIQFRWIPTKPIGSGV